MDKNTLSNYGWIVIAVLVLSVMIALATPFGEYIKAGVESTTAGLFDTSEKALNVVGMSAKDKLENLRDKYAQIDGYVHYSGEIKNNGVASCYIRIPVVEGEEWYVEYPTDDTAYMIRLENSEQELLNTIRRDKQPKAEHNPETSIEGRIITIPSGASYMCINLMMDVYELKYDFRDDVFLARLKKKISENPNLNINWTVLGDSVTQYNYGNATRNWVVLTTEETGYITTNLAISGYGYKGVAGSYIDLLDDIPKDTNLITFYGSWNDIRQNINTIGSATDVFDENSTNNTLAAYMNYVYDYVQTNFPNAKIAVMCSAPRYDMPPSDTTSSATQYVAVMQEICEMRNIPFLDLFHNSKMTPWDDEFKNQYYYNADGRHPNNAGHELLASSIIPFIKGVMS